MKFPSPLVLCLLSLSSTLSTNIHSAEFIEKINKNTTNWVAGRNFPEDTEFKRLKLLAGSLAPSDGFSTPKVHKIHDPTKHDIPEEFDARLRWPNCQSIKGIRDQGECGSCWAVSAVDVMTDRTCIHSDGADNFEYSLEDLLACCHECGDGCEGGYVAEAWRFWIEHGIASSSCKPYDRGAYFDGDTPLCLQVCKTDGGDSYEDSKRFGASHYSIQNDERQIQIEIMTNGPVQASFEVYEDIYNYRSGIYHYVDGLFIGTHSVKIIGWGIESGTPYWLISNTWGKSWAFYGGFFRFLRGVNHLSVEEEVVAGLPKL